MIYFRFEIVHFCLCNYRMKIKVQTLTGETVEVEVEQDSTVKELRVNIVIYLGSGLS